MSRCKAPFNINYIWQGLLLLALVVKAVPISTALSSNGAAAHLVRRALLTNSSASDLQPFQLKQGYENSCSVIAEDSYLSGLCQMAAGNYEFARREFSKCNTQFCRLRSGDVLYLMGNEKGAKNKWINLGEPNFLLQRAINAFRSGNFQLASLNIEAAEDSDAVLINRQSINPVIPYHLIMTSNTLRDIGIDLQDSGDKVNSKKAFRASLFANPQNSFAAYRLALIYHDEGDFEAAENQLRVALLSNSISLLKAAYLEQGHLLFEQRKLEGALASFTAILNINLDHEAARLWRGIVYYELERWELSRDDFQSVLHSHDPIIERVAREFLDKLSLDPP